MPRGRINIDVEQVVELVKKGKRLKEIAVLFNTNQTTISRRIMEQGLNLMDLRPKAEKKIRPPKYSSPKDKAIKQKLNNKRYWTDEQEVLVRAYRFETDGIKRSLIYSNLSPFIRKLISGVLFRYFAGFIGVDFNRKSINNIVDDCESFLVEKVLPKFNPDKAKFYAYGGTCAKHYLYDIFEDRNKYLNNNQEFPNTEFIESNSAFDHLILHESFHDDHDHLLLEANSKLSRLANLRKTTTTQKQVLNELQRFIGTESNYNRHYLTYYLSEKLCREPSTIQQLLKGVGVVGIINSTYSYTWYQKKKQEAIKKGIPIKDFFNLMEDRYKDEKYNYRIQEKKKRKNNRKRK